MNFLVGLLYFLTGKLGLMMAIPPGYATAVWPPSGIALGAVLIGGAQILPGVGLGSFAINLWVTYSNTSLDGSFWGILLSLIIGAAAIAQAYLSGILVQKFVGYSLNLSRPMDILKFLIVGGPVGCLVNPTLSVLALYFLDLITGPQIFFSWATWWIGDAMGVIVITPVILTLFGRPRELWKRRVRQIALPLLGAFAMAVIAFDRTATNERAQLKARFQMQEQLIADDLEAGMKAYSRALRTVAALHLNENGRLKREDFNNFIREILPMYPGVLAVSWNPVVKGNGRAAFEAKMQKQGLKNYRISERLSNGKLVKAGNREVYSPVAFLYPLFENASALGFDTLSDPLRRRAVEQAAKTRGVYASETVTLVQDQPGERGLIIYYPIFLPERKLDSYVAMVIRTPEMVQSILGNRLKAGDIALHIADSSGTILYNNGFTGSVAAADMKQIRDFKSLSGIDWRIETAATDSFLQQMDEVETWLVLVGGLLFTGLLGGLLLVITGRNELLSEEISRRMVVQSALAESEARKAAMLESSLDAIISMDTDGGILEFNRAAEMMFGYRRREVTGRLISEVIIPERFRYLHSEGLQKYLESKPGSATPRRIELTGLKSDGSEFPLELSISSLIFRGRPLYIGFLRDISLRRSHEEELKAAKESAESANMAKSAFLANMSHEIRTPLGAILGFSELITDGEVSPSDKVTYADAIRRNGKLLTNIINDILDLSRVEAGKLAIELRETTVAEVLSDVTANLKLKAEEKGLRLTIHYGEGVPKIIRTDPLRLRQILLNIVGNAVKFTEKGTVQVRLELQRLEAGGQRLAFVVEDSGVGIDKDEAKKLFQPFGQIDVSSTRRFGGSGLGLVLSKRLARLLGGDVVLTSSRRDKGSVFTITIDPGPVHELSPATLRPGPLKMPQTPPNKQLQGVKVLLADDSLDNQLLVSRLLTQVGATIDTAENGKIAVEKAIHDSYDLILMDIQMPVMDGYEALEKLREIGNKTPVVALTAHSLREEREECLERGFNEHISKPINRSALFKVVADQCHL